MFIKFELGQKSYIRHFDRVIAELQKRGHTIEISTFWDNDVYSRVPLTDADHRHILMREVKVKDGTLGYLSYLLRCARDNLLYSKPGFTIDSLVARRILNHLTIGVDGKHDSFGIQLAGFIKSLSVEQRQDFEKLLIRIEELIPHDPTLEKVLMQDSVLNRGKGISSLFFCRAKDYNKPAALCITPLVITQLGQNELVKAAQAIGIPVIFLVNSWDNLTTKGTIHTKPDWTIVWNQVQAREAKELHGIPAESIRVTGAPRFDEFFARSSSQNRKVFLERLGLDHSKPIITYLCSSNLISANEKDFVRTWIKSLRSSSIRSLADVGILLRPHPKFREGWKELTKNVEGIAVCASEGLNNDDLLYNCLYHSSAVVGANTSAELEAAILNKPVFSIRDPFFHTGQEGTVHYRYLLSRNGGFVEEAGSIEEHLEQLAKTLVVGEIAERNRAFVEWFIRPGGIDRPAAEITADTICDIIRRNKK